MRPDCHKRTNAVQLHVCKALRAIRFIEAESRIVLPREGELRLGSLVLNGYAVSDLQDEKSSGEG